MMSKRVNRRDFIKTSALVSGLSVLPIQFFACSPGESTDFLYTPPEFDIYPKFKTAKKLVRFNTSRLKDSFPDTDQKSFSLLYPVLTIFQGLINRQETRLWLDLGSGSVDWLAIYRQDGYNIPEEEETDFTSLIRRFAGELDGYIIFDPDMLHSLNVAQTWASLENWMVITPDLEPLIKSTGLILKEDLRKRWPGRVPAYEWAFENLFPRCSKHLIANYCVDYPSGVAYVDRDFSNLQWLRPDWTELFAETFSDEEVAALVSHFRTGTGSKQVQIIDHTVSTQVMMTLSFAGKLSPMPGIEEERARMQALWNEEDERMRFSIQDAANAEGQAFALSPLGKRYFTTVILNLTGMVNQRLDEIATQRPDQIQLHGDSVRPFVEGFKRESA